LGEGARGGGVCVVGRGGEGSDVHLVAAGPEEAVAIRGHSSYPEALFCQGVSQLIQPGLLHLLQPIPPQLKACWELLQPTFRFFLLKFSPIPIYWQ